MPSTADKTVLNQCLRDLFNIRTKHVKTIRITVKFCYTPQYENVLSSRVLKILLFNDNIHDKKNSYSPLK